MTQFYYAPTGLSGIEEPIYAGWPYHGPVENRSLYDTEIIGHPDISVSWRFKGNIGHYLINVGNQNGDWSYFFARGFYGSINGNPTVSPCVGAQWHVGLPLKKLTNGYLAVSVGIAVDGSKLIIDSLSYNNQYGSSDAVEYAINMDFSGCVGHTQQVITASEIEPDYPRFMTPTSSAKDVCGFGCVILDYFGNKLLLAVTTANTRPEGPVFNYIDTLDGSVLPQWFRYRTLGRAALLYPLDIRDKTLDFVCVYELVLNGDTLADFEISEVLSAKACEGSISRSSPTTPTLHTDPITGITTEIVDLSLIQNNSIIDAWYDPLGNVQTLKCSVSHSCHAEVSGEDHNVEFNSSITVGSTTKTWRQVLERYKLDETDKFRFVRNRIWQNGIEIANDEFDGNEHEVGSFDITIGELTGGRALFAGAEARNAVISASYGLPSYKEDLNMSMYSVVARNNGSGTCVFYGVIENFWYWPGVTNTKRVSESHIYSRAGNHALAAFSETVEHGEPKYFSNSNNRDYAVYKGYLGGALFGTVNLKTGAYYSISKDTPLYSTFWM